MALLMVSSGTIDVVQGSAIVSGNATNWQLTVNIGDLLRVGDVLYDIATIDSDTQLTLAQNYTDGSATQQNYSIRLLADLTTTRQNQTDLEHIIRLIEAGVGFSPDATGTLAERANYDDQAKGYIYTRSDVSPFEIYIKKSATTGDWSGATTFKGDPGAAGKSTDYEGSGVPASGLGAEGDTYLNKVNGDIYEKASGVWGVIGSYQGPQGNAATIAVGATANGSPGSNALVANSGSTSDAVFNFTIPQGDVGPKGDSGAFTYYLNADPTAGLGSDGESALRINVDPSTKWLKVAGVWIYQGEQTATGSTSIDPLTAAIIFGA